MIKIGEFSKWSHLTVKALRFYESEGLLMPASIDEWTGYRFYETSQLRDAAMIKAYRQLGLSVEEIKSIRAGADAKKILVSKAESLLREKAHIDTLLSSIHHILEDKEMTYHVTEKVIPKTLVYYSETVLEKMSDIMSWIPSLGEECLKLNPDIKCAEPPYEFCEFPDFEYQDTNVKARHCEAVTSRGKENDIIKFKELPETKVLSTFHQGSYSTIVDAYAFLLDYAKENNIQYGLPRECYIDGIWNKESEDEWLTEVQLPIE